MKRRNFLASLAGLVVVPFAAWAAKNKQTIGITNTSHETLTPADVEWTPTRMVWEVSDTESYWVDLPNRYMFGVEVDWLVSIDGVTQCRVRPTPRSRRAAPWEKFMMKRCEPRPDVLKQRASA